MLSIALRPRDLLMKVVRIQTAIVMMTLAALGEGRAAIRTVEVGPGLSHLIVNKESGAVYVGGINKVYELSPELQVVQEAVTGPHMDSPDCLPPPQVCTFPRHLMDNYNKLLVFVPNLHLLITCGSVFQGACETRPLFNLSQPHPYYTAEDVTNMAVAANSPEGSTVGFVAPGVGGDGQDKVLYVAASYTGTSRTSRLYRDQVPALSSRSLHKDHRFVLASLTSPLRGRSSSIFLKSKVRVTFPIRYVTGFSDAGFSYFLAVQNASVEGEERRKVSKLIQICQKDVNFFSYADVPLFCRQQDKDYNVLEAARIISPGRRLSEALGLMKEEMEEKKEEEKILVAAFSRRGEGRGGRVDSALCMYRMVEVRARLLENIKLCHHGNTSVSGGGYLRVGPRGNCNRPSGLVMQKLESGEHYLCNSNLESFSNVVGIIPVRAQPILQFLGQRVTALAVTQIHRQTVAFLGTDHGRLKKVVVTSDVSGREYREDQVTTTEDSVIVKDIVMDPRHRHLYLLTQTTISKVAVEDCGGQSTCTDCLREGDPYCGWCSLEKRCTVQALCPHAERPEEGRWLQGGGDLCIHINSITPTSASVTKLTQLHLTIPQLPVSSGYKCVWVETGWSTWAELWYFGARCLTPDFPTLNMSLDMEGSRVVTLGVESVETNKVFVSANFTFYNCSNFHTCRECADSAFDCHWCVYDNGCYHDTHACQSLVVAGKSSGREGAKGATLCPRVDTQLTGAIFVSEGVASTVMLIGHNLPPAKGEKGYRCEVNTGSHVYHAPARRLDDCQLTCSLPEMHYRGSEAVQSVDLAVYWGQHFRLDTSTRLVVRLYRCGVVGEGQCSVCAHLNVSHPHLHCRWCRGQCTHPHLCPRSSATLPLPVCPPPRITKIWPLSGPVGGGTKVTIEGRDLGIRFKDIEKGVEIGGVPCVPLARLYLPARRIVCRLEGRGQEGAWPVQVTVTPHPAVTFPRLFHFMTPVVHARRPHQGSISGASGLTIMDQCIATWAIWGLCWGTFLAFYSGTV